MKIALGQFETTRDKGRNLERIAELVIEAKRGGNHVVIFPEAAMFHLTLDESLISAAERIDGPFLTELADLARTNDIVLIAGVFESIADNDRVYNTTVVLNSDGSLLGKYRKIHLFDAFGYEESRWVEPGDGQTLVLEIEGMTIGVMTCYDVRFPEMARHLTSCGTELIVLPAAWAHGLLKEEHWDVLVRARAIENTVYVAAAGQVGAGTSGRSMIVDPMGVPIASGGEAEGIIAAVATRERVAHVRSKLPTIDHLREDVYLDWGMAKTR